MRATKKAENVPFVLDVSFSRLKIGEYFPKSP